MTFPTKVASAGMRSTFDTCFSSTPFLDTVRVEVTSWRSVPYLTRERRFRYQTPWSILHDYDSRPGD
ncbi:hypothetical protein AVEN_121286-1 [Araneus ventricosus]|uniref:Uncharacterized protein n=1 Tax=Araneus ventricosus TaxID=182803 RepID=A0A4Y2SRA5_ARAVE|nr:hypothetical protein AVEN_121286-1 [Araneus ventricosus]